ncbi:FAD-binding oxidoreductase [Pseudoduganella buxea]|uniref:Oxidoreductase n=1 Tax=Pseudoduganella buxea TaxID=1949069 RepID=A0A6I3SUG7_9BURK|nr:FAD-binding oxidoreductase [Pseudoduganella buxea]MTV52813.1 oxidoreductase [Pseudoduganella buxea]GGC02111.1 oxidoreductase [Pseudoduganella buxea]
MTTPANDGNWRRAVIVRIEPRTPGMRSYFLHAPLLRHVAGQHVDVRLTAPGGYQAHRSYSIASSPGAADIELAIAAHDDGEVSGWFHDVAAVGDTFDVRGPLGGHFTWDGTQHGPLLLVGGGAGIVPLVSIARAWRAAGGGSPLLVLHSAREASALAFSDELAALGNHGWGQGRYVTATTRGAPLPGGFGRRIDAAMLDQLLDEWGNLPVTSYLCGPTAFVEAMGKLLVARGLPARSIRTERFG